MLDIDGKTITFHGVAIEIYTYRTDEYVAQISYKGALEAYPQITGNFFGYSDVLNTVRELPAIVDLIASNKVNMTLIDGLATEVYAYLKSDLERQKNNSFGLACNR